MYHNMSCSINFIRYVKNGGDSYVYCDDKKEVTGLAPQCEEDKCANAQVENGVVTTSGSGAWIWVKVRSKQGPGHGYGSR